jgi:hypothetical protein
MRADFQFATSRKNRPLREGRVRDVFTGSTGATQDAKDRAEPALGAAPTRGDAEQTAGAADLHGARFQGDPGSPPVKPAGANPTKSVNTNRMRVQPKKKLWPRLLRLEPFLWSVVKSLRS